MTQHPLWNDLSESAQDGVLELIHMLASKFTGRIELECMKGGIQNFRDTRNRKGNELKKAAVVSGR